MLVATYIIGFVTVLAILWQAVVLLVFLKRMSSKAGLESVSGSQPLMPLSVIVCARNEAPNLRKFLPGVLAQQYPRFEVVVVDDASKDDTPDFLEELQQEHPHLRVVCLEEKISCPSGRRAAGKKFALAQGILAAKNPHLVLTDADCQPLSNRWLHHMATAFGQGVDVVIGYSPLATTPGWLNRLQRYETTLTALLYLGRAAAGKPYMAVGRNLAYRKAVWQEAGGFSEHAHILSGDDDLFVQSVADSARVSIAVHPEAWVESVSQGTWRDWFRQKQRHLGAGKLYRPQHKGWLAGWAFSYAVLYGGMGALAIFGQWVPALCILIFRATVQMAIFGQAGRRLGQKDLWYWAFLLDVCYFGYLVFVSPFLILRPSTAWK